MPLLSLEVILSAQISVSAMPDMLQFKFFEWWGNVRWGIIHGGELSGGELSGGEMSVVGNCPVGKYP